MHKRLAAIAGIAIALAVAAPAADNPFAGKWKIDGQASSWSDGKFPKNMSLTIDVSYQGEDLKYHSVNDTAKNRAPSVIDFVAKFDGKQYPITGSPSYDQVTVRRLAKNELEVLELKNGDVIVSAVWELLPGGKRLVRRGVGKYATGISRAYEEFFDKQ